jgi:ATP-binding cassette subfamily G (WHITE) protein 1
MTEPGGSQMSTTTRRQSLERAQTTVLKPKQKLQLSWRSLSYEVKLRKKSTKQILSGVSGHASPGEVLAIMGSSGAGKTTLLNVLSGRANRGATRGEVTVNGHAVRDRDAFRRVVAFVTQDDLMLETQTPREVLQFSAALRLPNSLSAAARASVVEAIILVLHLEKAADTVVGTPDKGGISGGERKRTNIGAELVTNPSLLFVDEPTSGLDAFTAAQVMATLKELAATGKTVASTIHQPASEIFETFDNLMLLHQGTVAYFGKADASLDHFGALGVRCPPHHNPADFLVNTLMRQLHGDADLPDFAAAWAAASLPAPPKVAGCDAPANLKLEGGAPSWRALLELVKRNVRNYKRNRLGMRARMGQTLFFALLIGVIFFGLGDDYAGIQDRQGLLFVAILNQMLGGLMNVVMLFPLERRIFEREHAAGFYKVWLLLPPSPPHLHHPHLLHLPSLYKVWPYFLSRVLFETPLNCFFPLLYSAIIYFLAGLQV